MIFIAASFFGQDLLRSLRELRTLGLVMIIYLILISAASEKRIKTLALIIIFSTAFFSLYASIGRTYMIAADKMIDLPLVIRSGRFERFLDAPFSAENLGSMTEAGQLLLAIPITAAFYLSELSTKRKLILAVAGVIMIISILLNLKRGAWLSLVLSMIILSILLSRKGLLIIITALIALILIVPVTRQRVLKTFSEFSTLPRFKIWRSGIVAIKKHPFGVGFGNSAQTIREYVPPDQYQNLPDKDHYHSNFIQIAVEGSLLALAAFLWLFFTFMKSTIRCWRVRSRDDPLAGAILAGGISAATGFFLNGVVEYNFGDSEVVMILYIIMGLTLVSCRRITVTSSNTRTSEED